MEWGKTSGRGNPALALLSAFSLLAGSASGQDSIFDDGFEAGDGSAWTMAVPALPVYLLSQTGLYANIVDKDLAPGVELFGVLFELWVDGADQQRFALLPPGVQIDSGLMDDWSLPVGTRLWKEVSDGGVRLWTEYIERWGNGPNDFIYAAYIWNADESQGFLELAGQDDVRSTTFDLPSRELCLGCHARQPARALGFAATQLNHSMPGVTLDALVSAGRLTAPPAGPFTVPGNAVERGALGYLQSNCGSCHNDTSDGVGFPSLDTRVETNVDAVQDSAAYLTLVNVSVTFPCSGAADRIRGGDLAESCVHYRMSVRDPTQMPPPGTSDVIDSAGLSAIAAWILTLPP